MNEHILFGALSEAEQLPENLSEEAGGAFETFACNPFE